jgi:predicted RNA-binding protein with PUA-like domain
LVKNARLSVQPVTAEEWAIICGLGNTNSDWWRMYHNRLLV